MVQDVGSYEEEVSNTTDKHGNALTKQKGDSGGDEVGEGEGEVEGTKRIETCITTVIDSRLQVLEGQKGGEGREKRGKNGSAP